MAFPAPSREELEGLSACMSGVSISRHQPKRLQSTTTPASVARPRAVRKLHDGSQTEEGSDIDEDLHDKENTRSTPVRDKQAEAKDMHLPQGVTPSRLACLGDLKDELTCCICLDICVRPVTTPCGHNFCRACLTTAQLHSNTCAKCREVLPRDFNLKVNTALWNTIRLLFPAVGLAPLTPVAPPQAPIQRRAISSTITAAQAFRRPRSTMPFQQPLSQQHTSTSDAAVPALHDPHSQLDMLLELLDTEPAASQPLGGHAYRGSHSSTTAHAVWPTLRPLTSSGRAQSAALQTSRPATVSTSLMYGQLQPLSVGAAMTSINNSNSSSNTYPRYISTSHESSRGVSAISNPTQPVSLSRRIPAQRSTSDSGTAAAAAVPAPLLVQRGSISQNGSSHGLNRRPGLLHMLTNDSTNPSSLEQWQAAGLMPEDMSDAVQGMVRAQASGHSVSSARNLQALLPQNPFMRSTHPYPTLRDAGLVGTQQRDVTANCPPVCPQQQQQYRPFARPSMFQRQPTAATAPHAASEQLQLCAMPRAGAAPTSEQSSQAVTQMVSMASSLQQQQQWGNESDSTHSSDQDLENTSDDDDVILLPTPQPSQPAAACVLHASHAPAVSQSATAVGSLLPPVCRQSHLRDTIPRRATADQTGSASLRTSPIRLPAAGHLTVLVAQTDCPQDGVEDTHTPVRDQRKAARPFVRSPDLPCLPVQNVQQATAQHSLQLRHDVRTAGWDTASMLYSEQAAHSTLTLTAFAPAPAVPSGHSTDTVTYYSEDDEEMITLDSLDLLSSPDIGSEHKLPKSLSLSHNHEDTAPCPQQRTVEAPCPQLSLPAISRPSPASPHAAQQQSVQTSPSHPAELEITQEDSTFVLFRGGDTAARRSGRIANSRGSQVGTDAVAVHDVVTQQVSTASVTYNAPGLPQVRLSSSVGESVTNSSTSAHASEQAPPPLRQSARLVPGLRRPSAHASSRH